MVVAGQISVNALDAYGNLARSLSGTIPLSYLHTCQDLIGTGVEPASVQVIKGSGSVVWTPPHLLSPDCYDIHGRPVRARTKVTATFGSLVGFDTNAVLYTTAAAGRVDAACNGEAGWNVLVQAVPVTICSLTIETIGTNADGQVTVTGQAKTSTGTFLQNFGLNATSLVQELELTVVELTPQATQELIGSQMTFLDPAHTLGFEDILNTQLTGVVLQLSNNLRATVEQAV
jgi:hypothetical protein